MSTLAPTVGVIVGVVMVVLVGLAILVMPRDGVTQDARLAAVRTPDSRPDLLARPTENAIDGSKASWPTPTAVASSVASATQSIRPTSTPTVVGGVREYVVQPGDTLGDIAERFGVESSAIVRANGLTDAERLLVGQRLIIPEVSEGAPSQGTPVPQGNVTVYVVQPGETLRQIAEKFGVTVADIAQSNPGLDPERVFAGQELRIVLP